MADPDNSLISGSTNPQVTSYQSSEVSDNLTSSDRNLEKKEKGTCMIFCNEKFDNEKSNLKGSLKKGAEKIANLFKVLNYKIIQHDDLRSDQIYQELLKFSKEKKKPNNDDKDIFVCYFSGHGSLNAIYGQDKEPLLIQDILSLFEWNKCFELRDKPKIFIIDACRVEDNIYPRTRNVQLRVPTKINVPDLQKDISVVYTCSKGSSVFDKENDVPLFAKSLCEVYKEENAENKNFNEIINDVKEKMLSMAPSNFEGKHFITTLPNIEGNLNECNLSFPKYYSSQNNGAATAESCNPPSNLPSSIPFINGSPTNNGILIIIDTNISRVCSSNDVTIIKDMFERQLNCNNVHTYYDVTGTQIHDIVASYTLGDNMKSYDALFIVILGQVSETELYGIDGVPQQIDDLLTLLESNKCPNLKDKPKWVHIEAYNDLTNEDDLNVLYIDENIFYGFGPKKTFRDKRVVQEKGKIRAEVEEWPEWRDDIMFSRSKRSINEPSEETKFYWTVLRKILNESSSRKDLREIMNKTKDNYKEMNFKDSLRCDFDIGTNCVQAKDASGIHHQC